MIRRKDINSEINKNINNYWTADRKSKVLKNVRKAIFSEIGKFEELQEKKIQEWAHKMVPQVSLLTHADRFDIKTSLRKYMRKQTVSVLGFQKYIDT